MTTTVVAVQILASGIVQMVGYRAWTARTARTLGVNGFVRNLHDGRVEIFAEGDALAVNALVAKCRQGPQGASIDDVTTTSRAPRGATAFVQVADAPAADGA